VVGARFHAAKERLKRQIKPNRDILQDLGVNELERGTRLLPADKQCLQVVQATREPLLLGKLLGLTHLVPDPATLGQLALKKSPLAVGEVDAVFVGLAHTLGIAQDRGNSKDVRLWAWVRRVPAGCRAFHPIAEAGGLSRLKASISKS